MQYAEAVFAGEIPYEEARKTALWVYDWTSIYDDLGENPRAEFVLERRLVLHNFSDGYIWVNYSIKVFDSNGRFVYGASRVPSQWKIHKTENGWEVVKVIKAI